MSSEWNDFAVLTCAGGLPKKIGWTPPDKLFPAETCARHVYVGRKEDFADIPPELAQNPRTGTGQFFGRMAYLFVLELITGLGSKNGIFDENVAGQIRESWNLAKNKNPALERTIKPYLDDLFADGAKIKTALMPFQRQPTSINIAIEMAHLSPEKTALIVCDEGNDTTQLLCALGTKRRINPGTIFLTHQEAGVIEKTQDSLTNLKYQKAIEASIHPVSFDQALSGVIFSTDAVFVCFSRAMGENEGKNLAASQAISGAWKTRKEQSVVDGGKLVHLRREIGVGWGGLSPEMGFVTGIEIGQEVERRRNAIRLITKTAHEIAEQMASERMSGESIKRVEIDPESLAVRYVMAKRPLGRNPSTEKTTYNTNHY